MEMGKIWRGKRGNLYPDLGQNALLLKGASDQSLEVHHLPRVVVHLLCSSGFRVFRVRGCDWDRELTRPLFLKVLNFAALFDALLLQRVGKEIWRIENTGCNNG